MSWVCLRDVQHRRQFLLDGVHIHPQLLDLQLFDVAVLLQPNPAVTGDHSKFDAALALTHALSGSAEGYKLASVSCQIVLIDVSPTITNRGHTILVFMEVYNNALAVIAEMLQPTGLMPQPLVDSSAAITNPLLQLTSYDSN